MTFSRSWRFAPESAPTRCDSASRMRSSSSECARSPLVSALTPSTDRVAFDARCRSQSAGANRIWKRRIGGAVRRATRSVKRIAKDFGASSPTTMCRKVIVAKATAIDVFSITRADSMPSAAKTGARRCAKAGSPIQPRPRLVSVIPSWVAERKTSRRRCSVAARRACQWPSAARASTRVARTRTMANSAATKKAFTTTRPRASATSRGSETMRSGREPAAKMLEERRPGRQAPVHDTRAGRVYAARGKADDAAGGGRMRRAVAVGMGCGLLFAGVVAAHARGDRELTNGELRAEMAKNSAMAAYVKRNGEPDVAESHFLADEPPWDDHEVTLYDLDARKEIGFARAWILGKPEIQIKRYERPLTDEQVAALASRAKARAKQAPAAAPDAPAAPGESAAPAGAEQTASLAPDERAEHAAARAEDAAGRVEAAADSAEHAADRAEAIADKATRAFHRGVRK